MSQIVNRAVRYEVGGKTFEGQLVTDSSAQGLRPGLLLTPNWMGVAGGALEIAREVAERGYVVLVADVYGVGVNPQGHEQAGAAMAEAKTDPQVLRQRLRTALDTLVVQDGVDRSKLAVFGFCFGGHCALELARTGAPVKAAVSFHGTLDTALPAKAGEVKAVLQVLDGAGDPVVPRPQLTAFIEEMTAAGADWQLTSYGGAYHSFTDPKANMPGVMQYDAKVARRAFAAMHDLLEEVFA